MKPRLHPLLAITAVPAATLIRCQQTPRPYDTCDQPIKCGGHDFGYPFWGLDRPEYCGHRSFQLTCQSDVPELVLGSSVRYRVLDIDSSTHSMTVARNDLWSTICPQYLHNTTYNSTVLNDNNFDQEDVSLYYGCQNNLPTTLWPLAPDYRFDCTVNGSLSDSYFVRTSSVTASIGSFFVQCNSSITVPVNRSSADRLATPAATEDDLRSALQAGFKLGWTVNNDVCDRCDRSGGRCGSNSTLPDLFVCYCASGNFSATCNNSNVSSEGKYFPIW